MREQIRCPTCGKLGSPKRKGYCKNCDPGNKEICVQCGKPAFRRRDDYEGCPRDWYCREHYEDRCGTVITNIVPDFKIASQAPPCEQCGKPAFKMDKNGFFYCKKCWMARQEESTDRHVFTDKYVDKFKSDKELVPKTDTFGIVKDKVGLMER